MIVDHVENDLDAGGMQRLNSGSEPVSRIICEIARLGREVIEGRIAPIVPQTFLDKEPIIGEGLDG